MFLHQFSVTGINYTPFHLNMLIILLDLHSQHVPESFETSDESGKLKHFSFGRARCCFGLDWIQ